MACASNFAATTATAGGKAQWVQLLLPPRATTRPIACVSMAKCTQAIERKKKEKERMTHASIHKLYMCVKERTSLFTKEQIIICPLSATIIKGCKQCPVATSKVPPNSTPYRIFFFKKKAPYERSSFLWSQCNGPILLTALVWICLQKAS